RTQHITEKLSKTSRKSDDCRACPKRSEKLTTGTARTFIGHVRKQIGNAKNEHEAKCARSRQRLVHANLRCCDDDNGPQTDLVCNRVNAIPKPSESEGGRQFGGWWGAMKGEWLEEG